MALLLFILASAALLLALALTPLVIRLAHRTGFLDRPGPRKIHDRPVPYGGGLVVAAAILAPLVGAIILCWMSSSGTSLPLPDEWLRHAPGVMARARQAGILAMGGLVILALGLADDRWKLGPRVKLTVQTLVAAGLFVAGGRVSIFGTGSSAGDVADFVLTVFWIVGLTNAFNLLDHMDGLSTGVAALAAAAFAVAAALTGQWFVASIAVLTLGSLLGFLPFNFPSARVFLGDGGSLFIGYWMAEVTLLFAGHFPGSLQAGAAVPLAILAVPLFDTMSVIVIRLRRGRPVFAGDLNHLAHRLVALGLSRRSAVLACYGLAALAGLTGLLLLRTGPAGAVLLLVLLAAAFLLVTVFESVRRPHEPLTPPPTRTA